MQYSDELLKACGVAIICLAVILGVGQMSQSLGFAARVGGAVLIFGILLAVIKGNIEGLEEIIASYSMTDSTYFSRAFSLMVKVLGISLVSKLCSDVCRDCGEGGLANGVDGVGRAVILSMCIPIVSEILGYAAQILSRT